MISRIPLLLALVLTLLVTGCAGNVDSSASAQPDAFTEVDTAFLRGMVPHHAQAVEMARLVEGRTDHPEELGGLAQEIIDAQEAEIQTMNGLLSAAGEEPVDAADDMDGHDMGSMDDTGMAMEGMMSAADMTALADATGATFDGLFLDMMIAHHRGAIVSAQQVLDQPDGNADVAVLAEEIISAQEAEIARMEGWQEEWGV